jgi:hypothetical protein
MGLGLQLKKDSVRLLDGLHTIISYKTALFGKITTTKFIKEMFILTTQLLLDVT